MSTITDIAKARILLARAKKAYEAAEADYRRYFEEKVYPVREEHNAARFALHNALEANGQCGTCETPKSECPGHAAYS